MDKEKMRKGNKGWRILGNRVSLKQQSSASEETKDTFDLLTLEMIFFFLKIRTYITIIFIFIHVRSIFNL